VIDLADERRNRWSAIRSGLRDARRIEGIARWSDVTMITHELQRHGWRRESEVRTGPTGVSFWCANHPPRSGEDYAV
jgi:hypothetical protein